MHLSDHPTIGASTQSAWMSSGNKPNFDFAFSENSRLVLGMGFVPRESVTKFCITILADQRLKKMMEEEKMELGNDSNRGAAETHRPANVVVSPTCTQRRKVDWVTRAMGEKEVDS